MFDIWNRDLTHEKSCAISLLLLLFYSGYQGGRGEINEDVGKKLNFKMNYFHMILILEFFPPTTSTTSEFVWAPFVHRCFFGGVSDVSTNTGLLCQFVCCVWERKLCAHSANTFKSKI